MKRYNIITIACGIFIAYMVGTLVWISSYSVLVADDFSHGLTVGAFNEPFIPYLFASFRFVRKVFFEITGAYFTMFIQALFSPINHYGLSQLRVVMAFNSSLFFLSLFIIFFTTIKKYAIKNLAVSMILLSTIVFSICGYQTYPEVFFWFSGATGYSFPLSMLLIALAGVINLDKSKKNIHFAIALLFGICAMGGNLTVSGTGCYVLLIIIVYLGILNKKFPIKHTIVFFVWFICALINATSPGQFNRKSMLDDSGIQVGTAIINSLFMARARFIELLNYNYLLMLMLVFLCGIIIGSKKSYFRIVDLLFSFVGMLTPVVTIFPYTLGTNGTQVPDRCGFVMDVAIILASINVVFILGTLVSNKVNTSIRILTGCAIVIFMVIYCKYDGYGLSDFKTYELSSQQIYDDIYRNHYYNHVEFYDWVRSQKGQDVVVTPEHCPYGIDNVYNLYLFVNSDEWVNNCVAQYCGVKSIRVDYD
ncbi:DUF6056 family protein [Butyrivibrio sp. AE2015]|uniref:DUF6056 family protein n=1 Tax=Butyrivibrio sp. AE2015 TaxID=1280663 RepID=UPI0003B76AB5|nr:DUF6056 family protein [Butyrivibrio sp. AE2015]